MTTPKRVAAAPEIPTLAEAGLPGFELVAWQGVVGARRPAARRSPTSWRREIGNLLADPATRDKLNDDSALEPLPGSTPESFAAYVRTEVDRWAVIVKASGADAGMTQNPCPSSAVPYAEALFMPGAMPMLAVSDRRCGTCRADAGDGPRWRGIKVTVAETRRARRAAGAQVQSRRGPHDGNLPAAGCRRQAAQCRTAGRLSARHQLSHDLHRRGTDAHSNSMPARPLYHTTAGPMATGRRRSRRTASTRSFSSRSCLSTPRAAESES